MTRFSFSLPLVLAVALLSGCASPSISLRTGPRSFTRTDYERVYSAWTRDEGDFDWGAMKTVLHATATFESWEHRWAYVVRYANDHAINTEARDEMLRQTLEDARVNHRFFVTVAGGEGFRESDIAGPQSAWRVLLVDDAGGQITPVEIQKIRRPSAAERVYFPSISPHRQMFRIVFPATRPDGTPTVSPSARHIILRFTGARGRLDLRWNFTAQTR